MGSIGIRFGLDIKDEKWTLKKCRFIKDSQFFKINQYVPRVVTLGTYMFV